MIYKNNNTFRLQNKKMLPELFLYVDDHWTLYINYDDEKCTDDKHNSFMLKI
jgi:hypothetical protein